MSGKNEERSTGVANYLKSMDTRGSYGVNPAVVGPKKHSRRKKEPEELFETKSVVNKSLKTARPSVPEPLVRNRKCGVEVWLGLGLVLLFSVLIGVALSLVVDNSIPTGNRELRVNEVLTNIISVDESVFYEVNIPSNSVASFAIIFSDDQVDPRMKLIERPNTILEINDDVSTDNKNSILFFHAEEETNLVLEIDTVDGEGEVTVQSVLIEEKVFINEIFIQNITGDEIFLSTLSLVQGETYEIIAFHIDEIIDELDAAIRVRDLDGNEIVEAFQSSVTEFTPRSLFTAIEGLDIVILEVRMINQGVDPELRILVRPISDELETKLDKENINSLPLFIGRATYVEMEVEANTKYSIELTHTLPQHEFVSQIDGSQFTFINVLGASPIPLDDGVLLTLLTTEVMPGVSCRVYNKENNEVIARDRTELEFLESIPLEGLPDDILFLDLRFSDNGTLIEFETDEAGTVVLEVARFNLNLVFHTSVEDLLAPDPFAFAFVEVIEETPFSVKDEGLVDENDLYPTCEIDQTKHVIGDDTCEQGIVLFCRNDLYPALDTATALRSDFATICDCTEFLCATLPGGDGVDDSIFTLFNVFYGLFCVIALTSVLIYVIALINLMYFGGISFYVEASNTGCGTWTLSSLFMICAFVYFSTKIVINGQLQGMTQISNNFDLNRIPIPSDEFQYSYYDTILLQDVLALDIIDDLNVDLIEGDSFLNEDALRVLPDTNFDALQKIIISNLVFSIFKDVLAIITFLDVSLVWLESTKFTALNRSKRKQQIKQFSRTVRVIEALYFIIVTVVLGFLINTSGRSYNVVQNVLLLFLAIFIIIVYCIGRSRLKYYFVTSRLSVQTKNSDSVWIVIRNVSTYVIAANIGIVLVQFYLMINVQNFDDLVAVANDPVALTFYTFQDICMFIGQIAIFVYLFRSYWHYRESLYVPVESKIEDGRHSERQTRTMEDTIFITNEKIVKPENYVEDLF